jgi:hypothetical protein
VKIGLLKCVLKETCSKVSILKYLSDNFHIQNGLKQRDSSTSFLFKFALEYSIRKVQEKQVGLKLNGTGQLLVYAENVNPLGHSLQIPEIKTHKLKLTLVRRFV